MEHDLNILALNKNDNFDPYNVLLAIATNIPHSFSVFLYDLAST